VSSIVRQCLLLAVFSGIVCGQQRPVRVYLIGTGAPEITMERAGQSTLISLDTNHFLFDAGRHTLQGLYKARIAPQEVTRIFLTHLHNDHIEGLPPLWMTPWFLLRRRQGLEIWGPPGTANMIAGMRQMFAHDIERRSNETLKKEFLDIEVHEIGPGTVYAAGDMTITAVEVEHHDGNPAFGYRFDAAGRSVLLTGDATLTANLLEAGNGVDILISNVASGTPRLEGSGAIDPILNKLMKPEQAARLFLTTGPRLAVYSHIVKKGLPGKLGDDEIIARTRKAGFEGGLVMGLDGMQIVIGDEIQLTQPQPSDDLPELDGAGLIF